MALTPWRKRGSRKFQPLAMTLPRLQELVLKDVHFDADGKLHEQLEDALMLRCEQEAVIEKLWLIKCYHTQYIDVVRFEEIVVDLEWDEVEDVSSDEDEDSDEDLCPDCGDYCGRLCDLDEGFDGFPFWY